MDGYAVRIMADNSKDTNERRKGFLALRPRLLQLEIKYGLFDPAKMWITKNGLSNDSYDPEDLRLFLYSFQHQPMATDLDSAVRTSRGQQLSYLTLVARAGPGNTIQRPRRAAADLSDG
ncbi:hypothetical protein NDU88_005156 [Pleurodeles waltl]|uniref:Uncharacterized protein n=1 Tax=Pleurodeles waltl TaxID=8319 RepID=A0AAV7WB73_PLEWA|nr:hypothetical protein NDU88_005156 [Pleurodeles waltl]